MTRGRAFRLWLCLASAACAAALAVMNTLRAGEAASDGRAYALMQGLASGVTPIAPSRSRPVDPLSRGVELCSGDNEVPNADQAPRVDLVLCALPRSTDKPSSAGPTTSGLPPQPGAGGNQPSQAPGFAYYPPGVLDPQDPGKGRTGDRYVYAPNIIFPLRLGPGQQAYLNSQIWGHGGDGWDGKGEAGGSECDPINYDATH